MNSTNRPGGEGEVPVTCLGTNLMYLLKITSMLAGFDA